MHLTLPFHLNVYGSLYRGEALSLSPPRLMHGDRRELQSRDIPMAPRIRIHVSKRVNETSVSIKNGLRPWYPSLLTLFLYSALDLKQRSGCIKGRMTNLYGALIERIHLLPLRGLKLFLSIPFKHCGIESSPARFKTLHQKPQQITSKVHYIQADPYCLECIMRLELLETTRSFFTIVLEELCCNRRDPEKPDLDTLKERMRISCQVRDKLESRQMKELEVDFNSHEKVGWMARRAVLLMCCMEWAYHLQGSSQLSPLDVIGQDLFSIYSSRRMVTN
ncbi:hypothetical protein VNO77_15071 [Canavalia gladiata]|uniref:Uncharacterized protein n=1 Tax=Canavalia gladiata TaxID=3824 RepID=A0AAN9LYP6_CANGL